MKTAKILGCVSHLLLVVPVWLVGKAYNRPHQVSPEGLVSAVCLGLASTAIWLMGRAFYQAGYQAGRASRPGPDAPPVPPVPPA